MSDVAAIVLAAGRGTRFGSEPKLLARLGGKVLVRHVVDAAIASCADPVIVVTGHRADEVETFLQSLPIQLVRNASFAEGLSTSLKAGFAALPSDARAAVILLADMPLVTADLIDILVRQWRTMSEPAALVPTMDGQRGNPVVISCKLKDMIEGLSGDVGAGPGLRGRADVLEWPIASPAILHDIDTRDAISRIEPVADDDERILGHSKGAS